MATCRRGRFQKVQLATSSISGKKNTAKLCHSRRSGWGLQPSKDLNSHDVQEMDDFAVGRNPNISEYQSSLYIWHINSVGSQRTIFSWKSHRIGKIWITSDNKLWYYSPENMSEQSSSSSPNWKKRTELGSHFRYKNWESSAHESLVRDWQRILRFWGISGYQVVFGHQDESHLSDMIDEQRRDTLHVSFCFYLFPKPVVSLHDNS